MVTMQDVADKAGVSLSTVSRVLNNAESVLPEKRERVYATIKELDFKPSYFARSLVTKKTGLVGVIVPDISYYFYAQMLSGIEDCASDEGFNIIICNIEEKLGKELRYLELFAQMRVAGIVLMHEKSDSAIEEFLLDCGIPLVMASVRPRALAGRLSSVNIDDFRAAYDATKFLLGKGRRRIALLADDLADLSSGEARFEGYKAALAESGRDYDESLVAFGTFSAQDGERLSRLIFERARPRPDAIFAVGDSIAIGALEYLRGAGLRVPEDVAVMGFDDLPFASICNPKLSTVRQPIRQIGIAAMELLVKAMRSGTATFEELVLAHEIVEREST
jgi:LacI family transcriptional regulator